MYPQLLHFFQNEVSALAVAFGTRRSSILFIRVSMVFLSFGEILSEDLSENMDGLSTGSDAVETFRDRSCGFRAWRASLSSSAAMSLTSVSVGFAPPGSRSVLAAASGSVA